MRQSVSQILECRAAASQLKKIGVIGSARMVIFGDAALQGPK